VVDGREDWKDLLVASGREIAIFTGGWWKGRLEGFTGGRWEVEETYWWLVEGKTGRIYWWSMGG
jgi:hypothetical protein